MPHEPVSCPDDATLGSLLAAPLTASAWWEHHLSTCAPCRERADVLLDSDRLRVELRALVGDGVPLVPPRLEGFDIERELQRGGQGVVYVAMQKSTGRRVALKVLLRNESEAAQRRMAREFEIIRRLERPGIVRLYDSGVSDGARWLAMELLDGVHLDVWLRDVEPRLQPRVSLVAEVARAVHFAHMQGVIHRDLKPSNVLVDRDHRPHVLDFGMSKPATDDAAADELTRDGEFAGTVAYAAPEQLAGGSLHADCRCDVYALGVLLYLAATGYHPFAHVRGLAPLIAAVAAGEVRAPRQVSPAIDRDLEAVILQAIAPHAEHRYQSAAALVSDLERWQRGDPVEARGAGTLYVLSRLWLRHRVLFSGAILTLLLVGLMAGFGFDLMQRATTAERQRGDLDLLLRVREHAEAQTGLWPIAAGIAAPAKQWLDEADALLGRVAEQQDREPQAAADADEWQHDRWRRTAAQATELEQLRESVAWRLRRTEAAAEVCRSEEFAQAWQAVENSMSEGAYRDARVERRDDLMPLRQDAQSGLWEAWHPMSGERPSFDATRARWELQAGSGVVFVLVPAASVIAARRLRLSVRAPALWIAKHPLTRAQWARIDAQAPPAREQALQAIDGVPADVAGARLARVGWRAPTELEHLFVTGAFDNPMSLWIATTASHFATMSTPPPAVTALRENGLGLRGIGEASSELIGFRAATNDGHDDDSDRRFSYGLFGGGIADSVLLPRAWIRPVLDAIPR